jgi:hypothetical protein
MYPVKQVSIINSHCRSRIIDMYVVVGFIGIFYPIFFFFLIDEK